MMMVTRETPDQDAVRALFRLAEKRAAGLYAGQDRSAADVQSLIDNRTRFYVARIGKRVVGCGGYAVRDGDGAGEVRRLFVVEDMRERGVGRALMDAVERGAREERLVVMRLETGARSLEARRFYLRLGYRARGPFADYTADAARVFMEKRLG